MTSTRWIVLLTAAAVVGVWLMMYFGEDHQAYLAFAKRRDDWHQRCDVYINTHSAEPDAKACQKELDALVAYATRRGWR